MSQVVNQPANTVASAERDPVALGIAVSAIILFVATGGMVLPQVMRSWNGAGTAPDPMLVSTLLLNIALVIFGWRRYSELTAEISERRKAETLALHLAEIDPLTGTLNRRSIAKATSELMASTAAEGRALAFIVLDLDNFKSINDYNGHKAGDLLLQTTAKRIEALLPPNGLVARLGGDEFACVVPFDPNSPDQIDQVATLLIERTAQPIDYEGASLEITVSVGLSATSGPQAHHKTAATATDLLHYADIAMFHAKKHGKNRYFWFEPVMETELRFRGEMEVGIRHGITAGEFVPYYEQQIDLETGKLAGFEMLARWNSPTFGLVRPDVFIPIAEEIGLISPLSETLIEQALQDAKTWDPSLTLSVNISPVQLRDPWFSQRILKLLVKHNFPPQRLDIEITESCLHENVGVVRSMITSLKNQGVTISLDDFGTGYSSLAQLRSLPFDRIKIDRSFVTELKDANASAKIIRAIISLGDGLEMPITAEGIEDTNILNTLKAMGRLKGQGYLYGKPEDASSVHQRLERENLLMPRNRPADAESDSSTGEHRRAV